MKTRLLKKVRKRFEITHMPKGFTYCGERFEYNLFRLTDSTNQYFDRFAQLGRKEGELQFQTDDKIFSSEKDCIYYLQRLIIAKLRSEGHLGRKDHYIKKAHKKVWWPWKQN